MRVALRKFAINVAALSGSRAIQTIASVLAIPVLARLLEPNEFGLLALALPFMLFGIAISDAGLGQSLVRVNLEDKLVWSSAFWLVVMVGGALTIFMLALAMPVSWLFRQPDLASIVATLSVTPLLQGVIAISTAELQQREQFRTLAGSEAVSSLCALCAAIALAFAGAGVWALVAQATLYGIIKAFIIFPASRFRPIMRFQWSALRGHIAFGRDSAMNNIVYFFQRQIDPLVIGRFLGVIPLGLYTMANRLVALPLQLISMPIQSALYVKMVALKANLGALRELVLASSLVVAIGVFPMMALGAASSEALFRVFLSDKWADAALIFSIIAPAAALQTIASLWAPMMLATENTGIRLRLTIELTLTWLLILPFAVAHSIIAVALAYTITYVAFSVLRSYPTTLAKIELTVLSFFGALTAPIVVSLSAAAAHIAIVRLFSPPAIFEVGLVIIELVLAVLALIAICWGAIHTNIGQLRSLLSARVGEGSPGEAAG